MYNIIMSVTSSRGNRWSQLTIRIGECNVLEFIATISITVQHLLYLPEVLVRTRLYVAQATSVAMCPHVKTLH